MDRRREQRCPRHRTELDARALHPHHRAGHADRKPAFARAIGNDVALRIEVHVARRAQRGFLAKIDEALASIVHADQHEPATADVAAARIDHGEGVPDGNRRVDRVAAGLEHVEPSLGGEALLGDDHGVRRSDHAEQRGEKQCVHERPFRDGPVKISCSPGRLRVSNGTISPMSTSYIGADALIGPITPNVVPGFDVLNPASYAETSTAPASSPLPSSSSSSTSEATTGQNPYQQALSTLESWQNQVLQQSLSGNTAGAVNALYSSAGLNADQFAQLATELQNLGSTPAAGSTVDTSA